MDRAEAASKLVEGAKRAARRLEKLSVSRERGEAKILGILARLQALGLPLSKIVSGIVIVDAGDDRVDEEHAQEGARLAREDCKGHADKRDKVLRTAHEREFARERKAAKGARFLKGDVYRAVAAEFEVSTRTVRRAMSQ